MRGVVNHGARVSVRFLTLIGLCGGVLVACKPDSTIAVTSFTDGAPGSLRAAVDAANRTPSDDAGSISIELPPGNYSLGVCSADDTNAGGDLDVLTNLPVQLVATGSGVVIRQTCAGERVLDDHGSGRLTLQGVTLTGGSVVSDDVTVPAEGGAVRAKRDVRLERVTITGNRATGAAARSSNFPVLATPGGAARGGGLFVGGVLSAIDSVLSENQAIGGIGPELAEGGIEPRPSAGVAEGGGAFVSGALEIVRTTFSRNAARGGVGTVSSGGEARGGAVAGALGVTSEGSTFSANQALSGDSPYAGGGGIPGYPPSCTGAPAAAAAGGAVWASGNLTSQGDRYSENASEQGAGCDGQDTTIYLPPLPGWPGGYIQYFVEAPAARSSGGAVASGGNVSTLASELVANRIERGYGSALSAAQGASVDAVTLRDNRENAGGLGHAIDVMGALALTSSQLIGNTSGVRAGSLHARAVTIANSSQIAVESAGNVTLVNTTVTGTGWGVQADRLKLSHCTITRDFGPGGLNGFLVRAQHLESHASAVVALQGMPVCEVSALGATSHNWFSGTCGLSGPGDRQDASTFLLGIQPLADNGGPVPTQALSPSSLLRDAVPSSACTVPVDARGTSRPQGAACDIGAFEAPAIAGVGAADLSVAFTNPPAFVAPGTNGTWTVRVRNSGPLASVPSVWVRTNFGSPVEATPISVSAPGATCTILPEVVCNWNTPIASGASATLTFVGAVSAGRQSAVRLEAQVYASALRAPLSDDTATVVTRVTPDAGLALQVSNNRYFYSSEGAMPGPAVSLLNSMLTDASATPSQPIRVAFLPAPGVSAQPVDGSTSLLYEQTWPMSANWSLTALTFYFPLSAAQSPLLGTLALDPGQNPLAGPASIPLYSADLYVDGMRSTAPQAPGAPVSFNVRVLNRGPGPAESTSVLLLWGGNDSPSFTWSVTRGTVAAGVPGQFTWQIGTLANGESTVLSGTAPYMPADDQPHYARNLDCVGQTAGIDFAPNDNGVGLNLTAAPEGAMDLLISDISVAPGPAPNQHVLRATLRNGGSAAAVGTFSDPLGIGFEQRQNASQPVGLTAFGEGWTCSDTVSCTRVDPFAAGASATFEWVLEGGFTSPLGLVGAVAGSSVAPADANPSNNSRFVATR
ncbi:MAG TPA: choice-of-anchor Q domain-containing protein [Polyangiaceae bacterium]